MRIYLIKQNKKTTDYVLLETDGHLLKTATGKVGKSGGFRSTFHAGTADRAVEAAQRAADEHRGKGFVAGIAPRDQEGDGLLDKAKWHVNDDFPNELDPEQSYVHSGMFIAWLIHQDLLEADGDDIDALRRVKQRQNTPSTFYREQLDGVFCVEDVKAEAVEFVEQYFPFETGRYIGDYLGALDPNGDLPSIFHVADTWKHYDQLEPIIAERFESWKLERGDEPLR